MTRIDTMRIALHRTAAGLALLLVQCSPSASVTPSDAGEGVPDSGASGNPDAGNDSAGSPSPDGGSQVSVTVAPTVAHTAPLGTVAFSASVSGASSAAVTWSIEEGARGGTISASGLYTAPSSAGTFHVVATAEGATGSALVIVSAVGDCSNLPPPGQWQSIAPVSATIGDTSGKNFSEGVVVDPFDPATVWLGTGFAGMFRSNDCGATWTHVNTGANGAAMDNGSHGSIAVDPVDRGTLYTVSLFGAWGIWKTTNGGVDWTQLIPAGSDVATVTNGFFDSVAMDPTDHGHIVLGMHATCAAPYAPTCEAESKDGGKTWRLLTTPVANWEEGAGPWIIGGSTWLYAGTDLWLTTNAGGSWAKITPAGTWGFSGGEVETHSIQRAANGTYYLTSSQGIVASSDGLAWSLLPNFPNRVVGLTMGNGRLFASDQWSNSYYSASATSPTTWSTIPPPAALPADQGAPFLDYDSVHHVLYASTFAGGLWRIVVP